MLKITMLRHGRTEGNSEGRYIGATDEHILGTEKQALKAVSMVIPEAQAVFTSPAIRCLESCDILWPGVRKFVIPELRECDFGSFEGKNYMELSGDPAYQSWIDSGGKNAFPGGESREAFQKRCCEGFRKVLRIAEENEYEEIGMVVHGGTIMSILDAYAIPHKEYFDWQMANGEGFMVRLDPKGFLDGTAEEIIVDNDVRRE